ncbi:MAG: hypothetical protein COS85_06905 [Armatimonadetes bacterium CG07_land_8_20_14_0_80_59_28]|nr:MAG: hypothetical protein COS85_06905 [Armatimonadetes bacterium CG07_land_8_20_14_0_80_59_28]PIX43461.1 MAG: hypothetical protein COZ56_07105 [Armatimonadetes bacterium CG_4_8_14_3_um_filter_58_9]PIY49463.1 MAG: hypothetical protein COZ05_00360 [Armatimonadetes bacterium CG_4_10_14_3_um_filter_59_10]PJB67996.1 MAG: hypothetical protein CO095_11600 [Armatimonadetes bacterium CG_4_9_14_3_um_filter_58_7]
MSVEGLGDLPWTEEQWERFMVRSDIRSAKFGELLETFMDHPDCEEIIAREMGWDQLAEGEDDEDSDSLDIDAINAACDAIDEDEWREIRKREETALRAIPAYARGWEFSLKVYHALKPYLEAEGRRERDPDDDLGSAYIHSHLVAAKIAGGHAMGYDEHVLCGNIVNCKRALDAAQKCLASLRALRVNEIVPARVLDPLIAGAKEIPELVQNHINELRSGVWWG